MAACNDTVLRKHIVTAGRNASYIPPLVQNDIISAVNSVLQRSIIAEVNETRFFSLLADETTDVSRKEQLRVCLRYVCPNFSIRERFLCFRQMHQISLEWAFLFSCLAFLENVTSIATIWLVKGMMARLPYPVISMV